MNASLRSLYRSYGGLSALVSSPYSWLSLIAAVAQWPTVPNSKWVETAFDVLPSLAGFSIAAFAILFSILDQSAREALRSPAPELGGRSPLLVLASGISHTLIVQITALIYALIYRAKPLPNIGTDISTLANLIFSSIGVFALSYAIILVLASVLSIFRMLDLTTG